MGPSFMVPIVGMVNIADMGHGGDGRDKSGSYDGFATTIITHGIWEYPQSDERY